MLYFTIYGRLDHLWASLFKDSSLKPAEEIIFFTTLASDIVCQEKPTPSLSIYIQGQGTKSHNGMIDKMAIVRIQAINLLESLTPSTGGT